MSRETPVEVREFAENCGYPTVECRNETHPGNYCVSRGGIHSRLNFLNDLNACFEALEHVAEWFEVGKSSDGFAVHVKLKTASIKMSVNGCSTPQAAIIRAVNAAAKARTK